MKDRKDFVASPLTSNGGPSSLSVCASAANLGPTGTSTAWPPPQNHIGTCGKCGGRVMQDAIWAGSYPPPKVCEKCRRAAKDPDPPPLPVLDMWERP